MTSQLVQVTGLGRAFQRVWDKGLLAHRPIRESSELRFHYAVLEWNWH